MNRRRQNILLVTVIILSAIIGLLAYLLIQRENSQGSLSFDKNASAWTPHTKSDTSGKQQIKIPGYDNITFAADPCDQQITLANPDKNPCNFTFELYVDQDDSPVYTSDMVKPGSAISHIRLNKTLDKGEHTLSIHISTFDVNSKEPLNSAISNAKLNVI